MKTKSLILCLSIFLSMFSLHASECPQTVDLLILGDSQFGATWIRSYTGNFLQQCLKNEFVLYARGGTIPGNWFGKGGMDQIETIQRDPYNEHLNIGSKEKIPACKKRLEPMIDSHQPKKILLEFGGNYISQTDEFIRQDIKNLVLVLQSKGIHQENCYFLHQTYEMEVATKRNVPLKNLANMMRIGKIINETISSHCQFIDGLELMKDSPFLDERKLLKRVPIVGRPGCMGAAANDNAHICGEAARDFAQRICQIIN